MSPYVDALLYYHFSRTSTREYHVSLSNALIQSCNVLTCYSAQSDAVELSRSFSSRIMRASARVDFKLALRIAKAVKLNSTKRHAENFVVRSNVHGCCCVALGNSRRPEHCTVVKMHTPRRDWDQGDPQQACHHQGSTDSRGNPIVSLGSFTNI